MRGFFGVSGANANLNEDLDGASSVEMENFMEVGVLLSKSISEKLSLSGGVNYAFAIVDCSPNLTPGALCDYFYSLNPDFRMLSIPIYAEYALGKIFYAAAGPILDFQFSVGNNFSDQSGVGYLVGLGAKVNSEKLSYSFSPITKDIT